MRQNNPPQTPETPLTRCPSSPQLQLIETKSIHCQRNNHSVTSHVVIELSHRDGNPSKDFPIKAASFPLSSITSPSSVVHPTVSCNPPFTEWVPTKETHPRELFPRKISQFIRKRRHQPQQQQQQPIRHETHTVRTAVLIATAANEHEHPSCWFAHHHRDD